MNEELLLIKVVRMLHEREDYFDKEWIKAEDAGQATSAAMLLGKACAYNDARQILIAALTNNRKILQEYDVYHKED